MSKVSVVIRVTYDDPEIAVLDKNQSEIIGGRRIDHSVLVDKEKFLAIVLAGAEEVFSRLKDGNRKEASGPV